MTWVSVKESLPDKHVNVLVFSDEGTTIAWWNDYGGIVEWINIDDSAPLIKVSHWQPLPEEPK